MADGPRFGEQPLPQTVAAAAAMRRLTSLLLSLEHAHPTVDDMLARFSEWEADLSVFAPTDPAPRIGDDPDGARIRPPAASPFPSHTKGRREWCTAGSSGCSSTASCSITTALPRRRA
jgi:hypothetical protein